MPELPEVETTASGIRPHLLGRTITDVQVHQSQFRIVPNTEELKTLKGQKILGVYRNAKYVVIDVGVGFVLFHLGMSGNLKVLDVSQELLKHDHIEIFVADAADKANKGNNTGKTAVLRLNDMRRFGGCRYISNEELFATWQEGMEQLLSKKPTAANLHMRERFLAHYPLAQDQAEDQTKEQANSKAKSKGKAKSPANNTLTAEAFKSWAETSLAQFHKGDLSQPDAFAQAYVSAGKVDPGLRYSFAGVDCSADADSSGKATNDASNPNWLWHCLRWHGLCLTEFFAQNGPDALSESFNGQYLTDVAKGVQKPVKSWLMDNNIVIGVGNIYANEALFAAGINPFTLVASISAKQWTELVAIIKATLKRSIAVGGTTFKDFVKPDGKPGYFAQELQVYGKKDQWHEVGDFVATVVIGGRSTFFVEKVQPWPDTTKYPVKLQQQIAEEQAAWQERKALLAAKLNKQG